MSCQKGSLGFAHGGIKNKKKKSPLTLTLPKNVIYKREEKKVWNQITLLGRADVICLGWQKRFDIQLNVCTKRRIEVWCVSLEPPLLINKA